jgi:hypothetical protein
MKPIMVTSRYGVRCAVNPAAIAYVAEGDDRGAKIFFLANGGMWLQCEESYDAVLAAWTGEG